ncbi:hypothetical protein ACWD33_25270 [Streptomyces xiamenensis]|uniref:hypothetical protein n=1 Tax=Streptomyces TaxID=1883 RepID=UPI0004CC680A|nr:hypothetical protein [Streptomyces sp. NRRL F-2890]
MGVVSKVFGRFRRPTDEAGQAAATAPDAGTAETQDAAQAVVDAVASADTTDAPEAGRDAGQPGAADAVDIPKQTAADEAADNEADEGARQQQ